MKLVFFQAALLAVASNATEASEAEQSSIWSGDWLVQTASIVDYFYPFQHDEEASIETTLAQNANEVEGESDADIDAELEAETLARIKSESGLSNEVLNQIEADCLGDPYCVKLAIEDKMHINLKDKPGNNVTIEMPAAQRKKVTFDSPKLTVEDEGFNKLGEPEKIAVPVIKPVSKL